MVEFADRRLPARFWAKVQVDPAGCWLWTARHGRDGYGGFQWDGRFLLAHRVAYAVLVAPAHLELVPRRVNVLRGESFAARNAERTHCPHGHALVSSNLVRSHGEGRQCRTCHLSHQRRWRQERRRAQAAG